MPDLVPLPGSERTQLSGVQSAGQLNESETITVTLVLRRRAQVPAALSHRAGNGDARGT